MKLVLRYAVPLALLVGVGALIWLSARIQAVGDQIDRLERELGHMPIGDPDRVHIAEIGTPEIPPEVASQLERVWQFRCYLPAGYDSTRFSGEGRVAESGVYYEGGVRSGSGSIQSTEAVQQLLTVSLYWESDRLKVFNAFGGSSGTSTWRSFSPEQLRKSLVIRKLVSSEQGPRSFSTDAILPLLKFYASDTGEDRTVAGATLTTYAGGLFAIYPKQRTSAFEQLRHGQVPDGFEPDWLADGAFDDR